MNPPRFTVALVGNPNSGKTTLFNAITGRHAHVGNYPGVTVELKSARTEHEGVRFDLVDLPGTYSLTAYSADEVIARNFILDHQPDVVIDIIDSSNLERNLYLATQLMELGAPLVLAFNKSDLASARGYRIDIEMLSELLGVPIVPTVGHKGKGIKELLATALAVAANPAAAVERQRLPSYGPELETEVARLAAMVPQRCRRAGRDRWVAVKLLEDDKEAIDRLRRLMGGEELDGLLQVAERSRRHIRRVGGDNPEILLADRRYGFISGACQEAVRSTVESRHQLSDRIDAVVTNRFVGLPLFLVLTLLAFQLTFWIGGPVTDWLEAGKDYLAGQVGQLWPKNSDSLLRSLLTDGLIEGVGAVVVFVPMVFLLFLAIAILEDSGYMARAAFVTDRLMHKIGLHGKSFIPMLIGFGCTVPAILATRTLENRRDRLTTMLVLPLFSCSARLPIYVLIIGAFFKYKVYFRIFGIIRVSNQALWMMLMYLIGVVLAVIAARLLRSTLFRGEVTPFVMELPPYRLPTIRGALVHAWQRTWMFLRKAGTVILGASIVLWVAGTFPRTSRPAELQAARQQAERAFLAAAAKAGRVAGLGQDIERLARADLALYRAGQDHWKDSPAYRAARQQFDNLVREMSARNKALARFVAALETGGQTSEPALAGACRAYLKARQEMNRAMGHADATEGRLSLEQSAIGRAGRLIAPVMAPCGFDWRISTGLIGAFAAKEIFVSQMGVIYALTAEPDQEATLRERLQANYTPLQGFCIMLYCLISLPCVATLATTWRESGALKWALLQAGGLTVLAWAVTAIVYQAGSALGLGTGM